MQRNSSTAKAVAQAPIPIATPESSQTLRSTVKSRKTEGSDCMTTPVDLVGARAGFSFSSARPANPRQRPNQLRRALIQFLRMIL